MVNRSDLQDHKRKSGWHVSAPHGARMHYSRCGILRLRRASYRKMQRLAHAEQRSPVTSRVADRTAGRCPIESSRPFGAVAVYISTRENIWRWPTAS